MCAECDFENEKFAGFGQGVEEDLLHFVSLTAFMFFTAAGRRVGTVDAMAPVVARRNAAFPFVDLSLPVEDARGRPLEKEVTDPDEGRNEESSYTHARERERRETRRTRSLALDNIRVYADVRTIRATHHAYIYVRVYIYI